MQNKNEQTMTINYIEEKRLDFNQLFYDKTQLHVSFPFFIKQKTSAKTATVIYVVVDDGSYGGMCNFGNMCAL